MIKWILDWFWNSDGYELYIQYSSFSMQYRDPPIDWLEMARGFSIELYKFQEVSIAVPKQSSCFYESLWALLSNTVLRIRFIWYGSGYESCYDLK
mgnify:CR=1 FL=1